MISNLIINSWLIFWSNSYCVFYSLSYSTVFISLLLLCWFSTIIWIVDFLIESFITLTLIEQLSLIVGIKLLLFSEVMLFFTCFWCYLNFRFIGSIFYLFYFPLFTFYSFSIPFGNLLIPLFSSLPIQSSQIFIKVGFLPYSIEGLGQSPSAGFYSIFLQCKEFSYAYFSLTDSLIGSIHYFTTGLHGFHVLLGSLLFFIIYCFILYCSSIYPFYSMEFSFSLFLSSHYWHFVDFIWFLVFLLVIV